MLRLFRALAILVGLAAAPAMAQGNWPEKPVKLVVGFTAGSATDFAAIATITIMTCATAAAAAWSPRWW